MIVAFYALFRITIDKKSFKLPFYLSIIGLTLFSIFAYCTPDFLGHIMILDIAKQWHGLQFHLEPYYLYVANLTNYNNILFRICVIVPSYVIIYLIIRNFVKNHTLFICCFVIIQLFNASNIIRSNFSDLLFYLGFLGWCFRKNGLNLLFFILCSIASFYLHKSAFMLFIPFVACLFPLKSKYLKLYILFIPLFIICANYVIQWIFNELFSDSNYQYTTESYSLSKKIRDYGLYSLIFILWTYILYKLKNYSKEHSFWGYIYRFVFFSLIIWISLFGIEASRYIAQRFYCHTLFPLTFLTSHFLVTQKYNARNFVVWIMLFILIMNILSGIVYTREFYYNPNYYSI